MASEEGKPFVQADEAAPTLSMLLAASNLGENGGTLFVLLKLCSSCICTHAYHLYRYVASGNAGKGGKGAGGKGKPAEGADKAAKGGAAAGKKAGAGKDKPPVVSKPPPSVLAVSKILYRSHLLSGLGRHLCTAVTIQGDVACTVPGGPLGSQRFYITTAINYTNGNPHMGHAYEVSQAPLHQAICSIFILPIPTKDYVAYVTICCPLYVAVSLGCDSQSASPFV